MSSLLRVIRRGKPISCFILSLSLIAAHRKPHLNWSFEYYLSSNNMRWTYQWSWINGKAKKRNEQQKQQQIHWESNTINAFPSHETQDEREKRSCSTMNERMEKLKEKNKNHPLRLEIKCDKMKFSNTSSIRQLVTFGMCMCICVSDDAVYTIRSQSSILFFFPFVRSLIFPFMLDFLDVTACVIWCAHTPHTPKFVIYLCVDLSNVCRKSTWTRAPTKRPIDSSSPHTDCTYIKAAT